MNSVINKILESSEPLSRGDIADVLASVGAPGKFRARKVQAIRDLAEKKGGAYGMDGGHLAETLSDWPEF